MDAKTQHAHADTKHRAPIAGRVTGVATAAGAPVDGMTAPFVIEADGSRWLALALPEALAGQVRPGMALRTADGRSGRIETVAASLDPETRAFAARARLEDGGPVLTGGRLLGVAILAPAVPGAVVVPAAAVLADPAGTQVFVKTAKGFVPRPVTRAGTGAEAVITGGLKAGETVAVSNLPELRAVAGQ